MYPSRFVVLLDFLLRPCDVFHIVESYPLIRWAFKKVDFSVKFIVKRFSFSNPCLAHTLVSGQLTCLLQLRFCQFCFVCFFSCQSFLTMSERRSLRVRTPSNRAVQLAASSQPPRKLLRTRDPAQTGNPPDAAHPARPPTISFSTSFWPVSPYGRASKFIKCCWSFQTGTASLPWYYRCHCAADYECRDTASSQHPKY